MAKCSDERCGERCEVGANEQIVANFMPIV